MSTVSSYSLNLLFLTQVFSVFASVIKFNEYITDAGNNITIPCMHAKGSAMWIKEDCNRTREIHRGHDLTIKDVKPSDSGTYICLVSIHDDAEHINRNSLDIYDLMESDRLKAKYKNYIRSIHHKRIIYEALNILLKVRSVPGPVSRLSIRISTILGVLMWDFKKNETGGYPLKSFTAEFRKYVVADIQRNITEHEWELLDPNNIPANVRYFEVYHLKPNTTYEFRIWANNYLGAGDIMYTTATTLSQLSDQELLGIVLKDVKDFDPRIWMYAVSVSMSAMVILSCTVCLLLYRDHYEEMELRRQQEEDEWETIELVPNIILNPGFYEEDPNNPSPPYTRTIIFGEDVMSTSETSTDDDYEPMSFKRKVSIFFTGDTIKRL